MARRRRTPRFRQRVNWRQAPLSRSVSRPNLPVYRPSLAPGGEIVQPNIIMVRPFRLRREMVLELGADIGRAGGGLVDDLAQFHHRDAVGQSQSKIEILFDHEDGGAAL